MPVNAFAIVLIFGTLPFSSMLNPSATSITIAGPTNPAQNQESGTYSSPEKSPQPLTVTGKLQQSVGIGGESSGWTIVLNSFVKVDGKPVDSIEVEGSKKKLESLSDQRVKISGVIVHKTTVERGRWPVLRIQKIAKAKAPAATALEGTHWELIEVGGKAALSEGKKAELMLDSAQKRAAASAGCNRLMGGYELNNDSLHFTQMAGTRMACVGPVMQQEQALIDALQSTSGYRLTGAKLELLRQDKVVAKFVAQ